VSKLVVLEIDEVDAEKIIEYVKTANRNLEVIAEALTSIADRIKELEDVSDD